ncbi:MAG: C4-dicarboxylate ABC transporter, partial [Ruthenibacterium sp.]
MKKALTLILTLALVLSLAACGGAASSAPAASAAPAASGAAPAADAEKASVKFGNTAGEDDIQTMALREVATRLDTATGGNFAVEVYPSSSLGDTDDLAEQAMQGAAILTISDPSRLASFVKDYGILGMP